MFYIFFLLTITTPKEDLRFQYVDEQEYDTSCGYSTVSSLLSKYWDVDVSEEDFVNTYLPEKIEKNDYKTSLVDLSKILTDYAIANKSYRMTYDQFVSINEKYFPVVVHYRKPDDHFALVLGICSNNIITADPARGVEILSEEQFLYRWSGIVLLTASNKKNIDRSVVNKAISTALSRKNNLERWAW